MKDCIEDGHMAIGLEGSDHSKKIKRAEWATIPDFLFTCDVRERFDVFLSVHHGEKTRVWFDAVTSWDVLEHIEEEKLPAISDNVRRHLKGNGLWLLSISPNEDLINGINLHRIMREKTWWIEKFSKLGFIHNEGFVKYFNTQFVRGPKYFAPDSFHLVLSRDGGIPPPIPKEGMVGRIKDHWIGSRWQKTLKSWVIGD